MALFRHVTLFTTKLHERRLFYEDRLGFPIVTSDSHSFTLEAGESLLEFRAEEMSSPPPYHFAFSIPENKVEEALAWTQERIKVVTNQSTGTPIYHFHFWNAHAFYFLDPEGNIGEFIGRHALKNAASKPFHIRQLLNLNELGVVTSDVAAVGKSLDEHVGLKPFPDPNTELGGEFQAVGDADGMFVVVKQGRVWLGGDGTASAFPAEVQLRTLTEPFTLADTLLRVR